VVRVPITASMRRGCMYLLIGLFLDFAHSWGPYTHAGFGSLFYASRHHDSSTVPDLLLEGVFITANFFPDAFKRVRDWMHSFEYATFQLEEAATWEHNSTFCWNNSIDFSNTPIRAFSYGYMLHMIQDFVGHYNGGYLNPKADHPLEWQVDTLFYTLHKSDASPWYYRKNGMTIIEQNPQVRQQLMTFISATSQQFAKQKLPQKGPNYDNRGGLSEKQVGQSIRHITTLVYMEQFAIMANEMAYQAGMVRYDACNATNFDHANNTLHRAMDWVKKALNVFEDTLFPYHTQGHSSNMILQASQAAQQWVKDTFAGHGGTICQGAMTILQAD
jgi:hypothetical protein